MQWGRGGGGIGSDEVLSLLVTLLTNLSCFGRKWLCLLVVGLQFSWHDIHLALNLSAICFNSERAPQKHFKFKKLKMVMMIYDY
jgi:hypothetical protein